MGRATSPRMPSSLAHTAMKSKIINKVKHDNEANRSKGPIPNLFGLDPERGLGDTPFEYLTYQLDGRIGAYHGIHG